jgi:hypothetical protein
MDMHEDRPDEPPAGPSGAEIPPAVNQVAEQNPTAVKRPWWVAFPLYGLPNRRSALASMFILVWVAVLLVIYGFRDLRYSAFAILFLPAMWWYMKAIAWVDRNGGWPAKRPG